MSQIEFVYNGVITIIQCNPNEKFNDIEQKLSTKIDINLNSVYYLYSGKVIDNKKQTFLEMANNLDKERKQMNIQIFDMEQKEDKTENSLIKSSQIICPECGNNCLLNVINYKVRLYDCINEHDIDEIALSEFENTQMIDESKIICDECKICNKANSYKKSFYICNTCKINLCPLCKDKHDKNHKIIHYEDKNFICSLHNYPYTLYCKSCYRNICISCEMEHNKHETISFGKIMTKKDKFFEKLNKLKQIKNDFIENIKDIITKLNKVIENIELLYKINEQIINIDYKYKNYEMLQNLNQIDIDYFLKYFENTNNDNNIFNKFKNIMYIYDKIFEKGDSIRIIYKIDKTKDKIKIFNEEFVQKYKNKCKIIYENKEHKLKEELETKKIQKNKIEIKLKGIENINNISGMLYQCNSLFSLPNVSKWNKNNDIEKINLISKRKAFTIALIGGSTNAGKTCLINKFLNNNFISNCLKTMGIDINKKSNVIKKGGLIVDLKIIDIPDFSHQMTNLDSLYRRYIEDGIIFVLDITDKYSLEQLKKRIEEVKKLENMNFASIICANRCDLIDKREVTTDELKSLGLEYNMKVFEISAKTGENVNKAFEELIELIEQKINK